MARVKLIQNSFNSGEWTPLLDGRTDLQKYASAAHTIENMICYKHGGMYSRPGTRFIAAVKDSTKKTRIIPFQFSTLQAYVIEMGDGYMRFYKDGGRIESPPGTPVEIVTPYATADLFDIHFAQTADVMYFAHSGYPPQKLERLSDTSWTLSAVAFNAGPWSPSTVGNFTPSGTSGSVTITANDGPFFSPAYVGLMIRLDIGGDIGYALITTYTDSTHVDATTIVDFPSTSSSSFYQVSAWSSIRGYPATVTLFQQRTWWGGSVVEPDTIWGSQVADYENFDPGTGLDSEAVTFTLASNRVNGIRWIRASRGLLCGTSGQEWIVSGGSDATTPITPGNPNAASETTHGGSIVAPLQVHNSVLFLQRSGRRLREFAYEFASDSYSAPDLTLLADHLTVGGITQMDYQQERDSIVWAIRSDGTLLGMTYEKPQDVIAWHRHITGKNGDLSDGRFESIACIPDPSTDSDQAWVIVNRPTSDLAKTITNLTAEVVNTPIGGGGFRPDTHATYLCTAHGFSMGDLVNISGVDPSDFNGVNLTIASVVDANHFTVIYFGFSLESSGIGGSVSKILTGDTRYVELLDTQSGYYDNLQVDAGLVYSGSPVDQLAGLDHLEGQLVDILGNGAVYPQQVVSGGKVVGLNPPVTVAEVGLHFNSTLFTMRPEGGGDAGTAQGAPKRFNQVIVRLDSSSGANINGERMTFRKSSNPMDTAVPLFTGDVKVTNLGWDTDGRILVQRDQPLPLTVLAIIGTISVGD